MLPNLLFYSIILSFRGVEYELSLGVGAPPCHDLVTEAHGTGSLRHISLEICLTPSHICLILMHSSASRWTGGCATLTPGPATNQAGRRRTISSVALPPPTPKTFAMSNFQLHDYVALAGLTDQRHLVGRAAPVLNLDEDEEGDRSSRSARLGLQQLRSSSRRSRCMFPSVVLSDGYERSVAARVTTLMKKLS